MPDKVCFENKQLTLGAPVQIIKGELCGIEGEVASMGNHTYVVIRMQGVLSASHTRPSQLSAFTYQKRNKQYKMKEELLSRIAGKPNCGRCSGPGLCRPASRRRKSQSRIQNYRF